MTQMFQNAAVNRSNAAIDPRANPVIDESRAIASRVQSLVRHLQIAKRRYLIMKAIIKALLRTFYFITGFVLIVMCSPIIIPLMLLGLLLFGGRENILWHIAIAPFRVGAYMWERLEESMEPDPFETEALINLSDEDLVAVSALTHHQFYMYAAEESLRSHFYKHLNLCEAECRKRNISKQHLTDMSYESALQWVKERKYLKPFKL